MEKESKVSIARFNNTIVLFVLFILIFLIPNFDKTILNYIPQLAVGIIAVYLIFKIDMIKPIKTFLFFAIYLTIMNMVVSLISDKMSIGNILVSSLRLYYPVIGITIGLWIKKNIKYELFLNILIFFLILQFIVSFLQVNNEGFRIWSYGIYRASDVERLLASFRWNAGVRAIGTIGNPNELGLIAVLLNSSILSLSEYRKNGISRILTISISIVSSLYILIYTQSRTSILLWIITVGLIIYFKFPKNKIIKTIYSVILLMFSVLIISFIQKNISRSIDISGMNSRLEIWTIRIKKMFEISSHTNFFTVLIGIGFNKSRELGFSDNIYLKYFISGGLVGFLIYLKTILDTIINIFKKISEERLKQLGIIILIVWIIGGFATDYQEVFTVSIVNFIILGFIMGKDISFKKKEIKVNS